MAKCFFSHSSQDKKHYINKVVERLNSPSVIIDQKNFEEGEKNSDEIFEKLASADIFVLFISNASLESRWVQTEIAEAKNRYDQNLLEKIYPLIIDKDILYTDPRIPEWLREYNLVPIVSPVIAAKKIENKIRELVWLRFPSLKDQATLFVGRNNFIDKFEEQYYDYDNGTPLCYIASGVKEVGRKSFLYKAIEKVSLVSNGHQPIKIRLTQSESIEDFILKLLDYGLTDDIEQFSLAEKTKEEKKELALSLIKKIISINEVILIDDSYCLITEEAKLVTWFNELLIDLHSSDIDELVFCIASSRRLRKEFYLHIPYLVAVTIPELNVTERANLFTILLKQKDIPLPRNEYQIVVSWLTGFPAQATYAASLIKEIGIRKVQENPLAISDYAKERISILLRKYLENQRALGLLAVMSKFEFITYRCLEALIEKDLECQGLISSFILEGICLQEGSDHELFRINDMVRDYVQRNRYVSPEDLSIKLDCYLEKTVLEYHTDNYDISDYISTTKEALIQGKIDPTDPFLLPSHLLKTIRDLYDINQNYRRVIEIAEILIRKKATIDDKILHEARYFLCLSLARLHDQRMLKEVQHIRGVEHSFLKGFYYRHVGRYEDAIVQLERACSERGNFYRAKRELVQVYINLQDFGRALELAKENYEFNPNNLYFAEAYFKCLVRKKNSSLENKIETLESILTSLEHQQSDKAQQMYLCCRALYEYRVKRSYLTALDTLYEAQQIPRSKVYPFITTFQIAEDERDIREMENAIRNIRKLSGDSLAYSIQNIIMDAKVLYAKGEPHSAATILKKKLSRQLGLAERIINQLDSQYRSN